MSPFSGVGMKADGRQKFIIGAALQDFDVNNPDSVIIRQRLKMIRATHTRQSIGRIIADVEVKRILLRSKIRHAGILANISSTIAQKPVSATRIYAGLVVLMITSGSLPLAL